MKKSFSLIELLIVVTIIAVLTGAALPFVQEHLHNSRVSKAKNDLDEIARAISAFEVQTGRTYSDTTGVVLRGRFIHKIPLDPWGGMYSFGSATDELGCKIGSKGPDGLLGGETPTSGDDDIVVAYKGALALVSATWHDVDQDAQITNGDLLRITFNRNPLTSAGTNPIFYALSSGTLSDLVGVGTKNGRRITFTFNNNVDGKDILLGSNLLGPAKTATGVQLLDPQMLPGVEASVTIKAYQ
ncbi:type II secretion system protein [Candidatus Riflebacteria bacterium]